MTMVDADPKVNRADLVLLVIDALNDGEGPPLLFDLEGSLARLSSDDQVGSFFRPYFRQALLHRAVTETLAFLETNGYVASNLAILQAGRDRVEPSRAMQTEIKRVLTTAHMNS